MATKLSRNKKYLLGWFSECNIRKIKSFKSHKENKVEELGIVRAKLQTPHQAQPCSNSRSAFQLSS